jgi:hypothetical protein
LLGGTGRPASTDRGSGMDRSGAFERGSAPVAAGVDEPPMEPITDDDIPF